MIRKIIAVIVAVVAVAAILIPVTSGIQKESGALDIICIEGQSNAENWLVGTTLEEINESISAPKHEVYYSANTVYSGDFDTVVKDYSVRKAYTDSWQVGGYIAALGQLWTEKYGRDVLIINTGIGSSSIDKLAPTGIYGEYVQKMIGDALDSDVVSEYERVNKIAWIWIQGEFDTNTIETYTEKFNEIDSMMQGYGFNQCYIVQTRAADSLQSIPALQQIIASNHRVHLATDLPDSFTVENGLLFTDDTHYTQKARNLLSEVFAECLPGIYSVPEGTANMIQIIPILVLAGLVIGVVGMFISRRD